MMPTGGACAGGIVAFLTSYGTLDKQDQRMRAWLAERAQQPGAYRLPSGIFAENGGGQAGTDLIILRKYHVDEPPQSADWLDLAAMTLPSECSSLFHRRSLTNVQLPIVDG
jgi:hypothetical protein